MIGPTLGRYFFSSYLKMTFYFLIGTFVLSLLLDYSENAGRLAGLPGYSALGAFFISVLRIPFIMQQLFPFIALFSGMATLMSLNRRLELVIARASGLSVWQFLLPACLGAAFFGIMAVVIVNPLAAWSMTKAETIITDWRGKEVKGAVKADNKNVPWLTQRTDEGTTTIGAKMITQRGRVLLDASFVRFNHDKSVADWLVTPHATLEDGYWLLHDVTRSRAGDAPEKIKEMRIATHLRPEFVEERLADPASIPFYQLPEKIKIARSFGYSGNGFAMQWHALLALPALLIAMTLISATVSLKFMRFGTSAWMIFAGIFAGFVLYVITTLVQAFGNAGYVPPFVAAWVPVIVAMFFGISFLLRREDG